MKRYPFVIGSTVAGLVGVLSFHTRATTGLFSHSLGVSAGSSSQGSSSQGSSSQSGAAGGHPSTGGQASPGPSSSGSSSSASSGPSSATGAAEQYGYGTLSVQVTVSGSKITDVQVASLQTVDSYSQRLAQQVIPYLRRQVLRVQTAHIYGVSGATYTSEAYAYSLQSALDKLHFH